MEPQAPMSCERLLWSTLADIKHLDITDQVAFNKNAHPFAGGSYGDLHVGTFSDVQRGQVRVAVKCLRIFHTRNPDVAKMLEKEIRVWSSLHHPNILPLLGYCIEENNFPSLVSEYMMNGTVLEYLKRHPNLDVTGMIISIAEGVGYIHDKDIVHSDLKTANILVSSRGEPLICDFGISRMVSTIGTLSGQVSDAKGSCRWMSPEILDPPENCAVLHTRKSDVWAFGMTGYELLTKNQPYHDLRLDAQVILAIVHGRLPARPENFCAWSSHHQRLWQLCETCWSKNPTSRPSMGTIIARFKRDLKATLPSRDSSGVCRRTVHGKQRRILNDLALVPDGNVKRKYTKEKNPRRCTSCLRSKTACRGGMPCERCITKCDPENCFLTARGSASISSQELSFIFESGQRSPRSRRTRAQTVLLSPLADNVNYNPIINPSTPVLSDFRQLHEGSERIMCVAVGFQ